MFMIMKRYFLISILFIPLLGHAQDFSADPNPCDFGQIDLNRSTTNYTDILNQTGVTVTFNIQITQNDGGFITSVSPMSGTILNNHYFLINVYANTTGLTPGQTYYGNLRITSSNGRLVNVQVILRIKLSETVSKPTWLTHSGGSITKLGETITFNTGGASSSLGHSIQYRFNVNGTNTPWNGSSGSSIPSAVGTYTIQSQARCSTDLIESSLSDPATIVVGYDLQVSVNPSGSGSITKNLDKYAYNQNESVTLTATPSSGYIFDHWEGSLTGSTNPGSLTMNGNKSVTAFFSILTETVSTPGTPTGNSTGKVGQNLSYSTGGSTSSQGHSVEYRYDWGDGSYSSWGSTDQNHTYSTVGNYSIKSQARCQTHTGIESGWSSGKSVTISGNLLSITINPSGSGTMGKSPDKSEYNQDEYVTLTPSPISGYHFDHWEGSLTGSSNPGSLTMNGDKSVTAVFSLDPETVSTPSTPTGNSTGKVGQNLSYSTGGSTSSQGHTVKYRYNWGDGNYSSWGSSSQSHTYSTVSSYTIKSQSRCQSDSLIESSWSTGKIVTISGNLLSITISPSGTGTVSKSPDKSEYNQNESVTLTPSPISGYHFDHWEGSLTGSSNPGSLTMNGDKSVTAVFSMDPETVSTPSTPTGNSTGKVGQNLSYSTGGSTSSQGHSVEYRYDWGDGSYSSWGSTGQNHTYSTAGNYSIKSQARCQTHTGSESGWSSGKSVTISGNLLSITINPSGSGTVGKSPDKSEYNQNEYVTLTPSPISGYHFDHWEGSLTGSSNPGSLTMNGDMSVTAVFLISTETVSTPSTPTGNSTGKVGQHLSYSTGGSTSSQWHSVEYRYDWGDGSYSSWGSSSQSHTYSTVSSYTIKSQSRCRSDSLIVSNWSTGKIGTISGNLLSITISPSGTGTVGKSPDKSEYNQNESVTLTTSPSSGYAFDHWEGSLTGNVNPGYLTMNGDKSVTAFLILQLQRPVVDTNIVANPAANSVTLSGSVNPQGISTTVKFQYGTTTSYGYEVTATQSPITGSSSVSVSAIITGLIPGKTYHYRLTATNSAGSSYGSDQTFTTLALDTQPPTVSHSATSTTTYGQSMNITSTVTDNKKVNTTTLYYRQGGKSSFSSVSMTKTSGSVYQGTIPSNIVTERGLEYYISAVDSTGNTATNPSTNPTTSPYCVQVAFANLSCSYSTPANSYRMISVLGSLDNSSPSSVLEDDFGTYDRTVWRLLRGQSGTLIEYNIGSIENMYPGKAFWLITKEAKSWGVGSGKSVRTAGRYVITLTPGWNQIGNPFSFPVSWSLVVKNGNVEAPAGYEGTGNNTSGYQSNQSVLMPWKGYCVKNWDTKNVTIEIPAVESTGGSGKAGWASDWVKGEGDWAVRLGVVCGSSSDLDNCLGCLSGSADGWDSREYSEPPPIGDYISVYFPHGDWNTFSGQFGGDFRSADNKGQTWEIEVVSSYGMKEARFSVERAGNLPEGWDVRFVDRDANVSLDMRAMKEYAFYTGKDGSARRFTVLAGPKEYVGKEVAGLEGIPGNYVLGQNYPNPFNPETRIVYELVESGPVRVVVYNTNGQVVRRLEDGLKNVGRYTVIWDGRDDLGRILPSGLYFYELQAGSYHAVKKMLLEK